MQANIAAKLVEEQGAKIIAVSDTKGAIINKNGFKVDELIRYKTENKTIKGFNRFNRNNQ